jgi:hypothetical protein
VSDLLNAAQKALDVLEAWQRPFGRFFHLEEWPIKWTNHGAVTITLTPRLLRNRQRSGELQSVEQVELGKAHNAAIDRLRAALAASDLSQQDNSTKSLTHADGCWSWGPAHYACACAEVAKLRGWQSGQNQAK